VLPDDEVFLVTERMVLRRFTMADVDLAVELDADPEVMRFITGGVATSKEEIEKDYLPAWLSYYERFDGYGFWAAIERSSDEFLGWFHLRPPAKAAPDHPELGYRLRRSAWGRGLATEGARALIDVAFEKYGAQRVNAETMAVNVGSRRVMEKSGLTLVRSFTQDWPYRIDGEEHGDVEYALTRKEWLAAQT
jgi:RimJ/RimL family protein N-acetyltransferase